MTTSSADSMNESALDADRPIQSTAQDLLERGPLVDQLASWVLDVPAREGFVVGVTGPRGPGKTSVLQLLAEQLSEKVVVAHFDPWLFSGADQLVPRFFDELAALLAKDTTKRIKQLVKRLTDYGAALSPAASVVLGPAGQLVAAPQQLAAGRQRSVVDQRKRLQSALLKTARRVVLIDDIDRLEPREVAEIMRLVKLVADLPGVVHVLSYDRIRVERALRQVGVEDGRAYLEKIVQISMAVPPVSKEVLRDLTTRWLGNAVGDRQLVGWDPRVWGVLVNGGVDEYLKTLRDGRRLCNVTGAALDLCADEVASMDVLALEAIRVFDPEVHERLIDHADLLTGWRNHFDLRPTRAIDDEQRQLAESLLEDSSRPDATRTILRGLFPAAANCFGGSREPSQGPMARRETRRRKARLAALSAPLARHLGSPVSGR
jgi:predicted KAP-like P-loop ATPase